MKLFAKHQPEFAEQWELARLRDRVHTLENDLRALRRETTCVEGESMGGVEFCGLDFRPRVNLKSVVLALAEHLGMDIKVEPAKPPSARVEPKEKGYVAERERGGGK
ncbi:MAG: hypothetical protein Q4A28_06390 [Brachymonas sp.]|nr:hypothetical protein [Brachymonas sp.]